MLIYTIQEKVNCYIGSLFERLSNSFHCIFTVEVRLKKMWIQDDGKPERVQNAETSFPGMIWMNKSFKNLL